MAKLKRQPRFKLNEKSEQFYADMHTMRQNNLKAMLRECHPNDKATREALTKSIASIEPLIAVARARHAEDLKTGASE